MTRVAGIALAALLAAVTVIAQSARTTLDIYLIDVEGGNATLFVSPAGESLLIDTGNGRAGRRTGCRPDRRGGARRRRDPHRSPDHDALPR